MRVSAHFGIQYLWIDSLCIIQDSVEDWRTEASTMRDVFRSSHLTISAVSGANDDAGLFYTRDTMLVAPAVVQLRLDSSDVRRCYRNKDARGDVWQNMWHNDGVTTKRGWCVQERLLSPRTIHFGKRQVFWECREQNASEVNPTSIYNRPAPFSNVDPAQRPQLWKQLIGSLATAALEDPKLELFNSWYDLVMDYSRCQLTVSSDKLIAIAGLADDMKQALDATAPSHLHKYLAGIWREDLLHGLCWDTLWGQGRSRTFRLPSWSWASMDGEVICRAHRRSKEKYVPLIKQHESTAESGMLSYSEHSATALVLSCHLILIRVDSTSEKDAWHQNRRILRQLINTSTNKQHDVRLIDARGYSIHNHAVAFDDCDEMPPEALLMPLHLRGRDGRLEDDIDIVDMLGLVLAPVDGQADVFRRIGYLEANGYLTELGLDGGREFIQEFPEKTITLV